MLMDRPLQIEVLINSPGPHDVVRVRQPFAALQTMGVDCRLHERPFRLNTCIRPHSLVIWQRPLPPSWSRQIEHLQWFRQRGCLLLTEWDDHPQLFPQAIQQALQAIGEAPLVACHAVHSSSPALSTALAALHPLVLTLENGVDPVPALNRRKHLPQELRVFIGNQNRQQEHQQLAQHLRRWLQQDPTLRVVVVGDRALASRLDCPAQVELHPLLPYAAYRRVLSSCQLALLPLQRGEPERCKTVIKWAECAAESVVAVAGPELYEAVQCDGARRQTCQMAADSGDMVRQARELARNTGRRLDLVAAAHAWVQRDWSLPALLPSRLELYQALWRRRLQLDARLVERLRALEPQLSQSQLVP